MVNLVRFRSLWHQAFPFRAEAPSVDDLVKAVTPLQISVQKNIGLEAAFVAMQHDSGGVVLVLGPVPLVQIARGLRRINQLELTEREGVDQGDPIILDAPKTVVGAWIGQVGGEVSLARFRLNEPGLPVLDVTVSLQLHELLSDLVSGADPLGEMIRQMDAALPRLVEQSPSTGG